MVLQHGVLDLAPLHASFGACISGLDLEAGVDDRLFASLEAALHRYGVLVIPGQRIGPESLVALARRFPNNGAPAPHQQFYLPGHRDVELLGNVPAPDPSGSDASNPAYLNKIGIEWHTDGTGRASPPVATLLYALDAPSTGGETLFASGYAGWDAQPRETQQRIARMQVRYNEDMLRKREAASSDIPAESLDAYWGKAETFVRPLVRVHPVTGKKALWLSWAEMECIVGLSYEESLSLAMALLERATSADKVYAHAYRPGDLVIWDNRCMLHSTTPYTYAHERRLLYRVGLECDERILDPAGVP